MQVMGVLQADCQQPNNVRSNQEGHRRAYRASVFLIICFCGAQRNQRGHPAFAAARETVVISPRSSSAASVAAAEARSRCLRAPTVKGFPPSFESGKVPRHQNQSFKRSHH